jgi:hypothetical protein
MSNTTGNEITFKKLPPLPHSTRIAWNIDRNGYPYAQIWTFENVNEFHVYHLKTLSGLYKTFSSFEKAEEFVIHLAG